MMNIKGSWFIWTMVVITLSACKSKTEKSNNQSGEEGYFAQLPDLAFDELAECDAIDIIMYDLPISMNHSEPFSIARSVGFITPGKVPVSVSCKPIGRITYLSLGNILQEADIYFNEDCYYYGFYKDSKIVYGHIMSEEGKNFYKNIIEKVKTHLQ